MLVHLGKSGEDGLKEVLVSSLSLLTLAVVPRQVTE